MRATVRVVVVAAAAALFRAAAVVAAAAGDGAVIDSEALLLALTVPDGVDIRVVFFLEGGREVGASG